MRVRFQEPLTRADARPLPWGEVKSAYSLSLWERVGVRVRFQEPLTRADARPLPWGEVKSAYSHHFKGHFFDSLRRRRAVATWDEAVSLEM